MKPLSAAAVLILALAFLIAGCVKDGLTGNAVKAAVGNSEGNDRSGSSSSDGSIGTNEESQEGCVMDDGLLDRIFSGHGSL